MENTIMKFLALAVYIMVGIHVCKKLTEKPEKTEPCDPETCLGFRTLHITKTKDGINPGVVPSACGFYETCPRGMKMDVQ